jgi:hypothetical protein
MGIECLYGLPRIRKSETGQTPNLVFHHEVFYYQMRPGLIGVVPREARSTLSRPLGMRGRFLLPSGQ